MGMTMTEKILARAGKTAQVKPGDVAVVEVETAVLLDMSFLPEGWVEVLKVHDPKKVAVIYDHMVPAPTIQAATCQVIGREFAAKFGIERLHDVGPDQGIAHAVVADRAYALPGSVLVCADSHTCAGGAFNCAARGVGGPDMLYAVTTGKAWFKVGETVRYDFTGKLKPGVSAKDIFLTIAGTHGAHVNQNVEYGGPGMSSLSINGRRTLATMGTELSADFVIFEPDDLLTEYVRQRNPGAAFHPTTPDADATYAVRRTIDLGSLEPLVALPDAVVNNSVKLSQVAGQKIDQAFIGSCANGTLDDLAVAAKVVKGRKVAKGVRMIVTPGTQATYRAALKAGYIEILLEAGAVVTPATCGACIGGHMGVLGPNEICITASTRNFKGRMGDPSSRVFMGSPATVAASALAGSITSAAEFFEGDVG
ncbi:MAG TPA: aconitase/3-isopropylmalate dehydratase large subunit family protein [Candidatus Sulfotelmatobacter sp.]|nr:aconitase/3-isopropylmalate dehydratase large subunit family protein [Candidatus Sulfotelmatobacter sp.]